MFQKNNNIYKKKKKNKQHNTETKTKQELPWMAYSFGLVLAPLSES